MIEPKMPFSVLTRLITVMRLTANEGPVIVDYLSVWTIEWDLELDQMQTILPRYDVVHLVTSNTGPPSIEIAP